MYRRVCVCVFTKGVGQWGRGVVWLRKSVNISDSLNYLNNQPLKCEPLPNEVSKGNPISQMPVCWRLQLTTILLLRIFSNSHTALRSSMSVTFVHPDFKTCHFLRSSYYHLTNLKCYTVAYQAIDMNVQHIWIKAISAVSPCCCTTILHIKENENPMQIPIPPHTYKSSIN